MNQPSCFSQTVNIDGSDYELEFNWNHRTEDWYVTISDSSGNALLAGVKIISDFDLFGRYSKTDIPVGFFVAIKEGLDSVKLKFEELNLFYMPKDTIDAL